MKTSRTQIAILTMLGAWMLALSLALIVLIMFSGCGTVPAQGAPPIVVMLDGEGKFYIVQCYNQDCSLYCINRGDGKLDCGGYESPGDHP